MKHVSINILTDMLLNFGFCWGFDDFDSRVLDISRTLSDGVVGTYHGSVNAVLHEMSIRFVWMASSVLSLEFLSAGTV